MIELHIHIFTLQMCGLDYSKRSWAYSYTKNADTVLGVDQQDYFQIVC